MVVSPMQWSFPEAAPNAPPARPEGPGGVGAGLYGSRHAPCPKGACVRCCIAPLCPLTRALLAGECQIIAGKLPAERQRGRRAPAVWVLLGGLCAVFQTLGCQVCAVQGYLLFATYAAEGDGLDSEVSETWISMKSGQRQASG